MDMSELIQFYHMDKLERYGEIYAAAFSGVPWNDPWKTEDAIIQVSEVLES